MAGLPLGFRIEADPTTRHGADGTVLWGGTPWRLLRLTPDGARLARRLLDGRPVDDPRSGLLARRLVDAGLAHPVPPDDGAPPRLEVVVPAYDRPEPLDRCLAGLHGLPVTVVDDGSTAPAAVAAVVARHGAQLIRRPSNGGPAAARNTGAAVGDTGVLAFVDSDCVVSTEQLHALARHFSDPAVVAVAPRVGDAALDLGDRPASVRPGAAVSYVPATTLLVRRTAFTAAGGFDEGMRYGEDVDLVWRLGRLGAVRYEPTVVVAHDSPDGLRARLARRYAYGTSVGPLERRHPAALRGPALSGMWAPVRLPKLVRGGLPLSVALRVAAAAPPRTTRALASWALPTTPGELAYMAGVWRGCLRARTVRPLLPRLRVSA